MTRPLRIGIFLFAGLGSAQLWADACYVTQQPATAGTPGVASQTCFEYRGMPPDSLDWACSTKGDSVAGTRKERRDRCPSGHFGICTGKLTQEALANELASGSYGGGASPDTLPEDAQIVTYYYRAQDQAQARIDCETGGGRWSQ